jgi:phenylalanyl-tRNA synthetase alpha subunit
VKNTLDEVILMKKLFSFFICLFAFGFVLVPSEIEAHYHSSFIKEYEQLDDEKKQQVDQILNHLHEELEKLGVKIDHPNVHEIISRLDEETQQQVKAIIKDLDEGKITSEEADKKLEQLGVLPKKENCKIFENLDDETKEKAKEIMKELKSGAITREKADEKFKELGIELPKRQELNDETKEKVKQLLEEAEKEFEQIGIEFPKHHYKHLIE